MLKMLLEKWFRWAITLTVLLICLNLFVPLTFGQDTKIKLRARQHFDTVRIEFGEQNHREIYRGTGPNFNLWLEKPYHFSFGLSYSVLFINNSEAKEVPEIGNNMDLTKIGFEFKNYFIPNEGGLFMRLGVSSNSLNTKGSYETLSGTGAYLGLGWEFKFSKIGLALEAAGRRINLEKEIQIETFSPSIGVHFYGYI